MQEKNTIRMVFSQRLRAAMKCKKMTQSALGEKAGVLQTSVSDYLKGKSMPQADAFYRISLALEVSMDWLLGIEEGQKESEWHARAIDAEEKVKQLKDAFPLLESLNALLSKITSGK